MDTSYFNDEIQFTIEDILSMHRYWITKLYLEDRKSELEIVQELHTTNSLTVTLEQIRKCFQDWNLIPTSSNNRRETYAQPSVSNFPSQYLEAAQIRIPVGTNTNRIEDRTPRTVPPTLPSSANAPSPSSSIYQELHYYSNLPLPPIPPVSNAELEEKSTLKRKSRNSSPTALSTLSLNPNTGPPSSPTLHQNAHNISNFQNDAHNEPAPSSSTNPNTTGPSPLEIYAKTQHSHELIAMGISSSSSPSTPDPHSQNGKEIEMTDSNYDTPPLAPLVLADDCPEGTAELEYIYLRAKDSRRPGRTRTRAEKFPMVRRRKGGKSQGREKDREKGKEKDNDGE